MLPVTDENRMSVDFSCCYNAGVTFVHNIFWAVQFSVTFVHNIFWAIQFSVTFVHNMF